MEYIGHIRNSISHRSDISRIQPPIIIFYYLKLLTRGYVSYEVESFLVL